MKAFSAFLLIAVVMMAIGCEGERGPTGPAGNANVKTGMITPINEDWLCCSLYWFQISTSTWVGYFSRYVDVPVEEITAEFISTGQVLVFIEANPGSGNWTPLPFRFIADPGYSYNIVYEVSEGMIHLHYFYALNDLSGTLPDLEDAVIPTYTFKYTVIAGTALQEMVACGVDLADHDRVMEYIATP